MRNVKRKLLVAALLGLAGCSEEIPAVHKFKQGDVVEFVVSGQKAQIIHVNHCEGWKQRKYGTACTYEVRAFSTQHYTNTHLLTKDGPITTTQIQRIDWVKEYELRKVE